jgi:2OG-Fe(II) oxygenase superfamily
MNLSMRDHGGYLVFDEDECRAAGKALHDRYVGAKCFPHIVLDELIDRELLRRVAGEFPSSEGHAYFDRAQERLKYQYAPRDWTGPATHNLFSELNSAAFVGFLEEMTGIAGLIVDPAFAGGGLHETKSGGHLGVHADFNINKQLGAVRQLNLLVYLNDEWPESYGGNLELWDRGMKACEVSVPPVLGKSVVFTTTLDSYHGQPDPVTCPPERSRRSMALYYYKAPGENLASIPDRTTNFQTRLDSGDRTDWKIKGLHLANDWVPPALRRQLGNLKRRRS